MKRISIAFLCALLFVANNVKAQSPDLKWAGVNANTGFHTDVPFVTETNTHINALQLGIVRMGMDGIGGRNPSASFSWADRDRTVTAHLNAGIIIHATVSPNDHVDKGSSTTEWKNNYRNFCANIFARYKGKIFYYILENEPDLKGEAFTPQLCVEMTQVAFEEARKVDATIRIESAPTSSAGKGYLRDMINLGVTRYCDVVGVHTYGSQIDDQHGENIGKPWEFMIAANSASGYPVRPVASSESSIPSDRVPSGLDERVWQARWFRQAWIAHKRWGYDNLLLYSLSRSGSGESWNIATWNGSALIPYQPTYDAIKSAYDLTPFANGNFESANDRELGWAINHGVDQANPFEWGRITFPTTDASNSRNGTGHCRMDMDGNAPGGAINTRRVRRVAETLTPNTLYTVTAYTKITGGGTATLKVQGFNHLKGSEEVSVSTSTTGSWQKLEVSFRPSRTWGVITLEGTGTGAGRLISWDDVSLTAAGGGTTTLRAPENPASTAAGLDYKYYEGTWNVLPTFSSLTAIKSGTAASFDLSLRNRDDNFAFSYTGFVDVPADGTYTFYTSSDDGSRLYIGSTLVVDNDGLHDLQERSGTIGLKAGKHAFTVTFFEQEGGESLSVSYSSAAIGKTLLPASALFRTSAPTPGTFSGVYTLTARHSGKVLDVNGAATTDGAKVQQYTANGSSAQQWRLAASSTSGYYTLTNVNSSRKLAIDLNVGTNGGFSDATANGLRVFQYGTNAADNRLWKIDATSDGYYTLTNKRSGKVLDVSGGPTATADGVPLIQWTNTAGSHQQWKLTPLTTTTIAATSRTTTATATAAEAAPEARLVAYPNPSPDGQATLTWRAQKAQSVTVRIVNQRGKSVGTFTRQVPQGESTLVLPVLPSGTYLLKATIDQVPRSFTLQVK